MYEMKDKNIGVRGFEPPAPCSQGRCATRLRHTPISYADKFGASSILRRNNNQEATNFKLKISLTAF